MKTKKIAYGIAIGSLSAMGITCQQAMADESVRFEIPAQTVPVGDAFDYTKGAKAYDVDGEDVSGTLAHEGEVNTAVPGEYPVTYHATGKNGTASFTVTHKVKDTVPPVISQTKNIILKTSQQNAQKGYSVNWQEYFSVTDDADKDAANTLKLSPVDLSKAGNYTVTFTAQDASGNTASKEVVITVQDDVDPILEVQNIQLPIEEDGTDGWKKGILRAYDENDGDMGEDAISVTATDISSDTAKIERRTVTLTDKAGNSVTKSFQVTYQKNTAPTISGPSEVKIRQGEAFDYKTIVSVTDKDGDEFTLSCLNEEELKKDTPGEYVLKLQATDVKGNKSGIFLLKVIVESKDAVVKFITNGGESMDDAVIEKGQMLEQKTPKYGNKKFLGWFDDEELTIAHDFTAPVTSDMTLYAKWEGEVKLTFKLSDDDKAPKEFTISNANPAGKLLEAPIREGFAFLGWKAANGEYFSESAIYSEDITFVAEFQKVQKPETSYTVTFRLGNGEEDIVRTVKEGQKVDYAPGEPSRKGYKFTGWFIGDVPYSPDFIPSSDTVVEAKWEEKIQRTITVSFNPNNGEKIFSFQTKEGETLYDNVPVPQREGYLFKGWFNKDGVQYFSNIIFVQDDSFIARWEPVETPDVPDVPKVTVSADAYNFTGVTTKDSIDLFETGNALFQGTVENGKEKSALSLSNYRKYGVTLSVPDGVNISGNSVSFAAPGTYRISLNLPNGTSVTATVSVVESKQGANLFAKNTTSQIKKFQGDDFDPYSQIGYSGDLTPGKDITYVVTRVADGKQFSSANGLSPGQYLITYHAFDGTSLTQELIIMQPPSNTEGGKPVLVVDDEIAVLLGKEEDLAKFATATGKGGKVSVKVDGTVDWNKEGKYKVTFSATDSEGKTTTKEVTVNVLNKKDYDAEISRKKAEGSKTQTSDISLLETFSVQPFLFSGAGTLTLLAIRKKKKKI